MKPNNFFFVSDLCGISGDYPYKNYDYYIEKYSEMFNNSQKYQSKKEYNFLTIQDIFEQNGLNFESYIIKKISKDLDISPLQILENIKKKFPRVNKTKRFDKYILKRIELQKGMLSEDKSISLICKKYNLEIIEIEKEIFHTLGDGINIKGRLDLITKNKNGDIKLIEIKQRIKSFRKISKYELYQVNFYLYLYGLKSGYLIEVCNGKLRKNKIVLDMNLIQKGIKSIKKIYKDLNILSHHNMNDNDDEYKKNIIL